MKDEKQDKGKLCNEATVSLKGLIKMSKKRALAAINLKPTDKIAWYEHIFHPQLVTHFTGIDAITHPTDAWIKMLELFDIDMIGIGQIPIPGKNYYHVFANETTQKIAALKSLNHQSGFTQNGTVWRNKIFSSIDDVYSYNPDDSEKGADIIGSDYRPKIRLAQMHDQIELIGSQCLVIPDLYTTLFMWPVITFDWELFLLAAGSDEQKFDSVVEKFFEVSKEDIKYWSQQNIDCILLHDDLCMSSGPYFSPKWYLKYIFPRYKKLFKPLKEKMIKIIFVSDGKADIFIDDLIECGIDGFNWDYNIPFENMLEKYSGKICLLGGLDVRQLSTESPNNISCRTKQLLDTSKNIPGLFFHISGGIPKEIPLENAIAYFETVAKNR